MALHVSTMLLSSTSPAIAMPSQYYAAGAARERTISYTAICNRRSPTSSLPTPAFIWKRSRSTYNPSRAVFMNAQLKHIQVGITRNNRVVRELQLTSFDDSNSARREAAATTKREVRAQIAEVGPRRSASSVAGGNLIEKAVLNTAETLLATWIEVGRSTTVSPLINPSAPKMFTVGNFAPVDRECPPDENVEIESGTIPSCLNGGVYLRNGANPRHEPGFGYHYFDGDGMLHIVKFRDGKATYCCRYIRTNRFIQEEKAGKPLFPKMMGEIHGFIGLARLALYGLRAMLGVLDPVGGIGTANAGLAFFNGKLLAMSEDDQPYAVHITDDGDLRTIGRYDFNGALKATNMTAHPKIDPKTGEMFSYTVNFLQAPYLTLFKVSADGKKRANVNITLPEACLIHDFAITSKYIVIPDTQIVFRMQEMFNAKSPVCIDDKKIPRFGVLPRNATTEARIKWFDLPDSSCFHYVNAWEEGDEIVVVGSTPSPIQFTFHQPDKMELRLARFHLNLKTGTAYKQEVASNANFDGGQFNKMYQHKKTRYVYGVLSGPFPKYGGIAKFDLEASQNNDVTQQAVVGWHKFPANCFCSEPYFVPRSTDPSILEDDGYILTYYHDEAANVSKLLVLDARSPTLEIVTSLKLPHRVPYGFHGLFVTNEQLSNQKPSLV
ncbi:hypothetical protein BDL97_02G002900 [Sphagnum fallax]|jgi:9-cis-epoxycarotenoid dioxygenase|nr:hypothetical protein BDL97_02G002900 [Sphagnum fallax]